MFSLSFGARFPGPNQIAPAVTPFEEWFEKGFYSASIIPVKPVCSDGLGSSGHCLLQPTAPVRR